MAFKPPKKQPEFADLKGVLNQSAKTDNALHQTVQILIERLTKYQVTMNESLDPDNPEGSFASKLATYLTNDDESAILPNSRQLIAGNGITFDDSVLNELTINVSSGYAPMSTGAEPLEIMSDGDGAVLMIGFTP